MLKSSNFSQNRGKYFFSTQRKISSKKSRKITKSHKLRDLKILCVGKNLIIFYYYVSQPKNRYFHCEINKSRRAEEQTISL